MKKVLLILVVMALTATVYAQAPEAFNYQAAARDASGDLIKNQNISLRTSIKDGSAEGMVIYSETHQVSTDEFGLFHVPIGDGEAVQGSFEKVQWGKRTQYLSVEIDINGGDHYKLVGSTPILSVPYAIRAKEAESLVGGVEAAGTLWLDGQSDPTQDLGKNNDYFMNRTNGSIFKKENDNWTFVGTLVKDPNASGESRDDPNDWTINGNAGTNPSTNFIGTTDGAGLAFRINNTDKMRLNSKGLVIGQTNVPDNHVLTLRQANDDKFSGMKIINASNTRYARFFVGSNGTVFDAQNGTFMLRNFNQDRLFMALDGKVGIGNKTPSEQLEVSGKVFSNSGGFMFPDSTIQTTAVDTIWNKTGNDIYFKKGYVGIGNDVPVSNLDVYGELTSPQLVGILGNFDAGNLAAVAYRGLDITLTGQGGEENWAFNTSVDGVTTGSGSAVGVLSSAASNGENNFGIRTSAGSDGNTRNYGIYAESFGEGTFNMGVFAYCDVTNAQTGETNYGIFAHASNAETNYAGYMDGDLAYTGSLINASDMNLKTDVQPMTAAMDKIMQLSPKSYYFAKPEGANINLPKERQYGLLAQDLEQIFPTMVTTVKHPNNAKVGSNSENDYLDFKGVNYMSLIPVLIKGMQEQQATIEALQKEIEELKK